MSSKLVERRLNEFQRRCGKDGDAALELACYAAIPVALNPEFLHFLRINFFDPQQLSYTVEFEFFTSGLCRAIDVELYEIEPETRHELLKRLMERNDAPQRIRDVATLLWQYVKHHSPWADRVELERAQQLTALHFLNPEKAQEWLDEVNADNSQNGGEQEWFIAMRREIKQLLPLKSEMSEDKTNEQLQFDVFLCHNSQEKPQVEQIRDQLKQYGIYARLDKYDFEPFRPWQDQLEEIISQIKAVAIFIGSSEVGPWANIEMKEFLVEFAKRKIPMALVILPDYPHQEPQDVPRFLKSFHKIDFRLSSPDPMGQLIWSITGKKPETIMEVIPQPSDDLSSDRDLDYNRAIADYNQALKLDPNYVSAYYSRGNVYYNLKDYDRAIAEYNQALKLDPNYVNAYNGRGNVYYDLKDYDRAIAEYNQALKLDPNYVSAYHNRGNVYYNLKDYDRAIADYNQALKLDPNYVNAYNGRGNVYYDLKDYERAIADYNQALKLDPNYVNAYNGRGNVYYNLKDYDRAIADYNQALKLDPNYVNAYNGRGNVYYDLKDYDRAIADYNQALKLDPNYVNAYNGRGNVYYDLKDYERAIADYNQALKLDPNYVNAYHNRGNVYYDLKDYDRAIAEYNQALKLDPNYVNAYYSRGNFYYNLKDYDRAIAEYNQALKLDPNYVNAYYSRGLICKNQGNKDKAVEDFTEFLKLSNDVEWNQKAKQHLQELGTF